MRSPWVFAALEVKDSSGYEAHTHKFLFSCNLLNSNRFSPLEDPVKEQMGKHHLVLKFREIQKYLTA